MCPLMGSVVVGFRTTGAVDEKRLGGPPAPAWWASAIWPAEIFLAEHRAFLPTVPSSSVMAARSADGTKRFAGLPVTEWSE